MARFSTKDLLVAITIIAIGLAMLSFVLSGRAANTLGSDAVLFLFITSGTFMGAGLFKPFGHPWVGAFVGTIGMSILLELLITQLLGN